MECLCLFFTSAEVGAPPHLSRRGEAGSEVLADQLGQFLQGSLQLDLESGFDARAEQLASNAVWHSFRTTRDLAPALLASVELFPDVLLLSGESVGALRTSEAMARRWGLPCTVLPGLDVASGTPAPPATVVDAVEVLLAALKTLPSAPTVMLLGVSSAALVDFASHIGFPASEELAESLRVNTEDGALPALWAGVLKLTEEGALWSFDSEEDPA